MVQWSKAPDLGSSHFDGVALNPAAATPGGFHFGDLPGGPVAKVPCCRQGTWVDSWSGN